MLVIHSDWMEYEAIKPIGDIAEGDEPSSGRMEEVLTVFVTVEREDDDTTVEAAGTELEAISGKVGVRRFLLYPYAHLSTRLASPKVAVDLLEALEARLEGAGTEVHRSPFGWYKSFNLKAKGHPLAEWSREITGGVTREEVREKVASRFLILFPDGNETEMDPEAIGPAGSGDAELDAFIRAEYGDPISEEPPSIKEMQRLELLDYESAGDPGHFIMYPKGAFMFNMLREWSDAIALDLDAMEIDTPIMYDWESPDIRSQVESFHERHYRVMTPEEKKLILRFAGDFGLFRMMRRATLSYRDLPVRMYEFSKSFRFEQRGELSGLKRLRAFHMPDIHSFARSVEEGWTEYRAIFEKYQKETLRTGVPHAIVFRVVEEFYQENKERLVELLQSSGRPAFVEVLSAMTHYWAVKNEFQGLDSLGGNCQLGTVQLDVVDAGRYGIVFTDADGGEKGCTICHCSIGSIERWIYMLLETAISHERSVLPAWIAPTQVRLIPVRDEFVPQCSEIAERIGCRVDIDDRDEKVGRRIRDAEREWIGMICVFGEKEAGADRIPVRMRSGEIVEMTVEEIRTRVEELTEGWPSRPLPLRAQLSRRFPFRG
jgi:threonyl-tRNA synthetase